MSPATQARTRKLKKNLLFWPHKYYAGLTRKQKLERRAEIQKYGTKHWNDPKAYVGFKTDAYGKRKSSKYTQTWRRMFPRATSLESKAAVTGVPLRLIRESYNRGLAAWRTGHRPGATEQQWGYARVASYLLCGTVHYGPDADLVRDAKQTIGGRAWFKRCKETNITRKN
jgi:hypothetical protein